MSEGDGKPEDLVWRFEDIEEMIPELKERDIRNLRIKKITKKLAEVVCSLSKSLKAEIKVVEGNRSHLLSMTKEQLEKVEPEILTEALSVVLESLINAVKLHKPDYRKLLQLSAERDATLQQYDELKSRTAAGSTESVRIKELETTLAGLNKGMKERDEKIKILENENENLRTVNIRLEREVDQYGKHSRNRHELHSAGLTSSSSPYVDGRKVEIREFYEMKKIIGEEGADLAMVAGKNKQISSLKALVKKKDQNIVNDDLHLNLYRIKVEQKNKQVHQLENKLNMITDELQVLKKNERAREREKLSGEVKYH